MRHILTSKQFSRKNLEYLMGEAKKMDEVVENEEVECLMRRLWQHSYRAIDTNSTFFRNRDAPSRLKGNFRNWRPILEPIERKCFADTIRIVESYADIIAIRSKIQEMQQ